MSETFLDLIQTAEREIRRDSEDLTRLKKRYPEYDFVRVAKGEKPETNTARPELSYLQTAILASIAGSSYREWTSRMVFTELTSTGQVSFSVSEEVAMNAVGLALTALAEAGLITRTHQGRGRDPHRYIAIKKEDKTEAPA